MSTAPVLHPEHFMTVALAASLLARCPRTIRRWLATGKLAGGHYPSGRVWVLASAVTKIRDTQ